MKKNFGKMHAHEEFDAGHFFFNFVNKHFYVTNFRIYSRKHHTFLTVQI